MSTPPPRPSLRSLFVAAALSFLCGDSVAQCPAWSLDALVPQFDDRLGASVDGQGGSLVVGVPGHFGQGQALVFEITSAGAVQTGLLWPSGLGPRDQFGHAVAVSGNVIVVGAPGDDDGAFGAGAVYVYERVFGVWLQTAKLQAPFAGLVSLFQKTTGGWVLRQEEPGTNAFERFGTALAMTGGTVAVGAPGVGAGRVELFEMAQTSWLAGPVLNPTGGSADAEFGSALLRSPRSL